MHTPSRPRILIIGYQGQVAWELKRTLAPLGEVIAAGRQSKPASIDLAKPDELLDTVGSLKPDWIINAAAYTAVDKAEQETDLAMSINGTAPGILAHAAKACGALLVHYSTDYVFDGAASRPYTELSPTDPQSVYGRTKLAGEQAIQVADGEHLIFRTSWVYANRGHNFLRTIRRLAREREQLRIVADQRGAPTWARHIAEATAQILSQWGRERAAWRQYSGIYHLTSAGETTWHEFATRIVELQKQQETVLVKSIEAIATGDYPLPAPRPRYSILDNGKLLRTFGIALPDWRVGLEQVAEELALERI